MLRRPSFARAGVISLGLALTALSTLPFASCSSEPPVTPPPDGGAGGSGGVGGGTATSSSTGGSTSTGGVVKWSACDGCLEKECQSEEAACDGECQAIQACLETVCFNLSAIGAMTEEGQCQVKCQGDHPDGKDKHIELVYCAEAAKCSPPCAFYPQDYDNCRSVMVKGPCKETNQACKDSLPCQNYKDCVSTCKTVAECIKCDDTEEGLAGRKVLEANELCVASECISESWLP